MASVSLYRIKFHYRVAKFTDKCYYVPIGFFS